MALATTLSVADFYDQFRVQDVQFVQGFQQQRSATGGGETRYADRAPSLWKAEITTIPMLNAEAEGIMALINSRAGGLKTVLMYNSRLPYPASDPTGSWLSSGSNLPVGAESFDYDFVSDLYNIEGRSVAEADVVSCNRATIALASDVAGNLVSFGENVPRITNRGLLIEPARTNLCIRSCDFDNAVVWVGSVIVRTPNAALAPDGTMTADLFAYPSGAAAYTTYQLVDVAELTQYTWSYFVKLGTKLNNRYAIYNHTASSFIVSETIAAGANASTWTRVAVTFTTPAGCTQIRVYPDRHVANVSGADGNTIYLWGAQIEAGAVATSPIVTAGAAVTRAADVITLALPPGTHDLSLDYLSGPQAVAGRSGAYVVPNAAASTLEGVTAVKTSPAPASPAGPALGTITDRLHVAFTGFPAGYVIPLGTYFSIIFDTSRYYLGQFAEARTANPITGTVAMTEIWPPLPASIAGTPDITIIKPPAKFRIEPGSAYPAKEGGLHSTIKFSAEQTYSR
ncbi:phage head spike fiber domain-containing protein [Devosia sp. Root635]|uniref:phage head spike fiber domain-containing protein n=1 Tax=Devosia sp. Root635 TaxID=1736575 RepID=UPI0006F7E7E9|nr:hypothetical protein [Devosia sp. Root635]KRA42090.1 hypothetical protein ASD80_10205 [Devosia sp. Root635]